MRVTLGESSMGAAMNLAWEEVCIEAEVPLRGSACLEIIQLDDVLTLYFTDTTTMAAIRDHLDKLIAETEARDARPRPIRT